MRWVVRKGDKRGGSSTISNYVPLIKHHGVDVSGWRGHDNINQRKINNKKKFLKQNQQKKSYNGRYHFLVLFQNYLTYEMKQSNLAEREERVTVKKESDREKLTLTCGLFFLFFFFFFFFLFFFLFADCGEVRGLGWGLWAEESPVAEEPTRTHSALWNVCRCRFRRQLAVQTCSGNLRRVNLISDSVSELIMILGLFWFFDCLIVLPFRLVKESSWMGVCRHSKVAAFFPCRNLNSNSTRKERRGGEHTHTHTHTHSHSNRKKKKKTERQTDRQIKLN